MQDTFTTRASFLTNNGFLLVTVLLIVDSLHFAFARLLLPYISPGVSAMYVLAIGTAVKYKIVRPYLIRRRRHKRLLHDESHFFFTKPPAFSQG